MYIQPMLFSMHTDSEYRQSALIPDASSVVAATVNSEGSAGRCGEFGSTLLKQEVRCRVWQH